MRESYRLNQHEFKAILTQPYVMMLVYQSPKMTTFESLNKDMQKINGLLANKLKTKP
jgi:hypothetical protein